jgi:hypothetical protein
VVVDRAAALPDVAAQQARFARFCRDTLGLEPTTLLAALGVGTADGSAGDTDPAAANVHAAEWSGRWTRRFSVGVVV